ncbi:MAG: D-alanyl-D-alanine carboxypeptidase [Oscillibacter sp.]|nr:D-alanyl-D-alanine carboxypeptidase [Oscillibacter sp.]
MFKRTLCRLLAALMLCAVLPAARAVETSAAAAILVDADSGRVLYEKNADERMRIASTTKLLTALVALELGDLADVVTVSAAAAKTEGSSMYLRAGEQLTLETLLYGLLLCSGNDAAVAVAEHISGSVSAFAEEMNAAARRLGMENSSFANPSGLDDPAHRSTARDMARLACAALENETLLRIASTKTATVGGRTMQNHNKLLGRVSGCVGLKTGYTKAAGRTLVSAFERGGRRLVAVTLRDGNDWADHAALCEYGYSAYPLSQEATRGEVLCSVPLVGGGEAPLLAAQSFSYPLAAGEVMEREINLFTPLYPPVRALRVVGEAVFTLNGAETGRVPLLCGRSILPREQNSETE